MIISLSLTLSTCSHIADYLGKDEILLNMDFDAKIISRNISGTTQEYIAIDWNVDMEENIFHRS